MSRRIALLPALLLLALVPAAARAAADSRVLIVETRKVILPEPFEGTDLVVEVKKELLARACPVVGICRSDDCPAEAKRVGATELLSIDATYRRDTFSCSLRAEVRGRGGELKFGGSYAGDTCPAADLVNNAKETAAKLCDELMRQESGAPPAAAAGGLGGNLRADAGERRRLSIPGLLVVGGGVVVAGLGGYLWYLHGECAHSAMVGGENRCGDRYDTRAMGIPLTVAGVAAMAVGGWLLWDRPDANVAVRPGSIVLSGRF